MLTKDLTAQTSTPGSVTYFALRCLSVTVLKITQVKAFEDKRFRREVQEHFVRVIDQCVLIAGRAPEASIFGRRAARDLDDVPPTPDDAEEKMALSLADLTESALADQMAMYLSEHALGALRQAALDPDRVATLCTNVVYYVVAPALRTKSRYVRLNSNPMPCAELCRLAVPLRSVTAPWTSSSKSARCQAPSKRGDQQWQTRTTMPVSSRALWTMY
jgi:hypothetical protein